jgi:hypothetical protein
LYAGMWTHPYQVPMPLTFSFFSQRVSALYPWICTYFGADAGTGVKANQAYDGRGMMLSPALATLDGPIVKFFLNISNDNGGGSW